MAYATIEGIRIYACSGELSGTIELPEDPIWSGALYFPHEDGIFDWSGATDNEYVVIANGPLPSPTAYYTQLLTYCPDFGVINGVCSQAASGSSGTLSQMFAGLVLATGPAGGGLHIVTKDGSDRAYAYTVDSDTVSDAVSARVREDGTVDIEGTPLCLPRLGANNTLYRFYGCLLHGGVRSGGTIGMVIDFALYGLRIDPGYGVGHRTSLYFFRQSDTYAATAAFLNDWLSAGGASPACFLQGLLTGQRLRAWSGGMGTPDAAELPPLSAGDAGPYHEGSFLAGLCAGRASRGWGGLPGSG